MNTDMVLRIVGCALRPMNLRLHLSLKRGVYTASVKRNGQILSSATHADRDEAVFAAASKFTTN
jgi:hypothetical protein